MDYRVFIISAGLAMVSNDCIILPMANRAPWCLGKYGWLSRFLEPKHLEPRHGIWIPEACCRAA